MVDITALGSVFQSLTIATDALSNLRTADAAFEKAEIKLQVANLVDALANAKFALSEVQDALAKKDSEIARLNEALTLKGELARHLDAYYEKNQAGNATGDPICAHCWEADNRVIHLHRVRGDSAAKACASCRTKYFSRSVPSLEPD